MKLQHKTLLMISAVILTIVFIMAIAFNYQSQASLEEQMGNAAHDMAISIANMPNISHLLAQQDSSGAIQNIITPITEKVRYQYIIVMDMSGIQYSYPYESGLYKLYKNGGEEEVLTTGTCNISLDTNELISAVRAFEPIFYQGDQVGAVLVGLLTNEIHAKNDIYIQRLELMLLGCTALGIIIAYLFSLNVKKSIFGLEPKEIALLLSEQRLIFQNIERGIMAINKEGQIILKNKKSELLLHRPIEKDKVHLSEVSQQLFQLFQEVMSHKANQMNLKITLEMEQKLMISMCQMLDANANVMGVIVSMEDITLVRSLAEEITDYRSLVDALRAQNHEFMNKLQVISGLLQLDKYDEALSYIEGQSKKQASIHHLFTEKLRDSQIAALLLSKYDQATEQKIEVDIDDSSKINGLPKGLTSDDVCLILANLFDNSMDAIQAVKDKYIYVSIISSEESFELIVKNSGPFIDSDLDQLFTKGYSSKGDHRGFGLYNIKQIVDHFKGNIYVENDEEVTWYVNI